MASAKYLRCCFVIACGNVRLPYRLPENADGKGGCHVPGRMASYPVGNGTYQTPAYRGGTPCVLVYGPYTGNGDGTALKLFAASFV